MARQGLLCDPAQFVVKVSAHETRRRIMLLCLAAESGVGGCLLRGPHAVMRTMAKEMAADRRAAEGKLPKHISLTDPQAA